MVANYMRQRDAVLVKFKSVLIVYWPRILFSYGCW